MTALASSAGADVGNSIAEYTRMCLHSGAHFLQVFRVPTGAMKDVQTVLEAKLGQDVKMAWVCVMRPEHESLEVWKRCETRIRQLREAVAMRVANQQPVDMLIPCEEGNSQLDAALTELSASKGLVLTKLAFHPDHMRQSGTQQLIGDTPVPLKTWRLTSQPAPAAPVRAKQPPPPTQVTTAPPAPAPQVAPAPTTAAAKSLPVAPPRAAPPAPPPPPAPAARPKAPVPAPPVVGASQHPPDAKGGAPVRDKRSSRSPDRARSRHLAGVRRRRSSSSSPSQRSPSRRASPPRRSPPRRPASPTYRRSSRSPPRRQRSPASYANPAPPPRQQVEQPNTGTNKGGNGAGAFSLFDPKAVYELAMLKVGTSAGPAGWTVRERPAAREFVALNHTDRTAYVTTMPEGATMPPAATLVGLNVSQLMSLFLVGKGTVAPPPPPPLAPNPIGGAPLFPRAPEGPGSAFQFRPAPMAPPRAPLPPNYAPPPPAMGQSHVGNRIVASRPPPGGFRMPPPYS